MLILASDHAGIELKNHIKDWCVKNNIEHKDIGPNEYDRLDSYVDYAKKAVKEYKDGDSICLCCGSGVGMSIVANRNKSIRAVLAYSSKIVQKAVEHNNANCICLGQNFISQRKAVKYIKLFLNTNFAGGRHEERIKNIDE